MKGIIKWYMSDSSTGEFSYDISERRFDTSNESIRDTIMNLLCNDCLLYTSPSPRDSEASRMPSSA